ncbi:putative mitochondrial hypothetical protein [Leptomonas pyrrhocoris]|uniref:Uncharacterized protein n=1 Tax=Leptomonas pyrrhocoris TaxID=157538 RepID=A0A0N0DYP8_LEPPY|nr:putative mitochondrial hypothetical protein [Leptomonas pyrrhocoris]XP_015662843.1 putative mitochondrial hypothetical protein [Leptomonas pyrrhocoris]XP_015662844.1 putative mitochondrial hypothetical protein [Leptomonas pyrrhocoris]KPA84403.1 putative mitochondrial hypothetical protein [Leptomonas pyrrhocoris]KPA84404.1 putative mitochondrial hypothetical protein [Leptomonas pyrrhocoris]KPA84405.1 putative mitochondrial hypothetical protein [Leptomonas pyrrhocoris]|eukprot:XP_015662842.1 putative mitochondrial hypothetical protein [Leptomonas pyrrhocoris]
MKAAAHSATTPSTRPTPQTNGRFATSPASQHAGGGGVGGVPPAGSAGRVPPVGAAKKGFAPAPAPYAATGAMKNISTPSTAPAGVSPGSRGVGSTNAAMPNSSYGTGMPPSAYGGSFMPQSGAAGPNMGAGDALTPGGAYGNSMFGMQSNGQMYPGIGMNSMYGMQQNGGNGMYNSGYGTSMMGPLSGGGGGSMYGMGSMGGGGGSMYGMGGPMGSMGGGYGFGSSFGGSLYGGSMYGATGSLYGTGGSLYGSNDARAIMGSMYGSRNGSIYGGFGSFYDVGGPHTRLGVVRKYSMPGFSYSFGSNLGTAAYHRNSFSGGSAYSGKRANSFRGTSKILQADEQDTSTEPSETRGIRMTERAKAMEEGTAGPRRGTTGVDKDGNTTSNDKTATTTTTTDREGRTPGSIVRKRAAVEAPKSPPSTRAVKAGVTQAPALSTDFRIHNVAVLQQDGGSNRARVTKKGDTCVLDGTSYPMDEVLEYTPTDGGTPDIKSRCIRDMIEHVMAGHNTAVLVSDDGKATAAATATVESTVAQLMAELNETSRNTYAEVSASMYGLHPNSMMRDLLVDGARLKSMEAGNSPLFGPALMNVTSGKISSGEDFNKLFEAALKRGEKETMMVCMLTVKQVRGGVADDKEDVFVSSVFIGVSRRGPKGYHDVVDKVSSSPHELFRYAVEGPSVCVHVIAVSQGLRDGQVLSDCAKIGEVQNTTPRSGNVRRFVDFTQEQLKRMRQRSDTATGADKRELEGHVQRLSQILEDAQKMLADPKNTEPKLYRLQNEPLSVQEESPREVGNAASPTSAAATKQDASKAEEPAKSRAVPIDASEKAALSSPQADRPSSTNVTTVAIVYNQSARAYSVQDRTITAGGLPFAVEEVIRRKDVTARKMECKATDKVLAAFLKGYNGAVVASDSTAVAANGMASPTMAVVFAAVSGALAKEGSKGVRVAVALVRDTGDAVDLTSTNYGAAAAAAGAASEVEVWSSPLFGPVAHKAAFHPVRSTEELQRLVDTARENAATSSWDEHCVVHVTVVHCFAEKDDILVSSLLATFASNNSKAYNEVLQHRNGSSSSSNRGFSDLYRYAFGGVATTAFVVSVAEEDEVGDVVNALTTQHTAGAVRNRAPRQGSISNFISFTTASLQKRRDYLATLGTDSAERPAAQKVVTSMERMLDDHKQVMADPDRNFPHTYAAESGASKDSAASPPSLVEKATTTSPSAARSGARSRAVPVAEAATATASTPSTSTVDAAQQEDPAASGFTEPRVVVFVGRDVASAEKKISLGDKDYAVDEVVTRAPNGGDSTAVAEIQTRLSSVHNCALVSASSVTAATTKEEPVWPIFEQCLRSAMAAGKPGEDVRADLTFAVVSADEVVADLLAEDPPAASRPLEVASSPIYGPRVTGTTTATVQSADELMHLMAKVHERAAAQLPAIHHHGAMMIGTAVMRRRMKDGDVAVASLTGILTGASVKAFHEVLEKEQVTRRMLLNCAYGGPSATVTILNLRDEDASAQDMVSTAVALSKKQRNLVSRSGSVLAFITYTEGTMQRELVRADAATGEAKERHLQKAERLRPVVADHRRLLEDFNAPVPAYLGSRSTKGERDQTPTAANTPSTGVRRSSGGAPNTPGADRSPQQRLSATPASKRDGAAGPNRIRSIVVITAIRNAPDASGPVARVERVDGTHVKTTVAGAARERECDEVVSRVDASSPVRADLLLSAAEQFVSGFNTAVLCCDLGGSNAGPTACGRLVHNIVDTKPAHSELYYAVSGIRGREARDLLQADSAYATMKVANSPIFGPTVYGATMPQVTEVGAFDSALSAAVVAAASDNAMVVVNVVLKAIQEGSGRGDVVVNSMLVTLATDPQAYTSVVSAPLKSDRKLFQYAVHGSCYTVGVLGLPDRVAEEGLAECLDTYDKLRTTENRPMRNGSVRRFLAYSMNAMGDVKQKLSDATDEGQRATYAQRLAQLELMVADSRALLESPQGRPLKVYQ